MKVAEALVKMKDMKGRLSELFRKLNTDALFEVVDDSQVVPDTSGLLKEYMSLSEDLANLKTRVAKTNAQSGLVDKINSMEQLRSTISQLENLAHQKQETLELRRIDFDGPAVKVKRVATYSVENLEEELNQMREEVRELDLELQRLNWEIDLVD